MVDDGMCLGFCLTVHKLCFWHVVLYLRLYRTDSEIYEDAVELQQFFIKIRDELCKNGEILLSPALSYTTKHLHNDVEKEKKEKLPKEIEEDKLKREEEKRGNYFLFINIECIEKYTYVYCVCSAVAAALLTEGTLIDCLVLHKEPCILR